MGVVGVDGAVVVVGGVVAMTMMIRPSLTMITQMSTTAAMMEALISTRTEAEGSARMSSDGKKGDQLRRMKP